MDAATHFENGYVREVEGSNNNLKFVWWNSLVLLLSHCHTNKNYPKWLHMENT